LLGLELSGEVIAVGDEVSDSSVGDRVMAIVGGGAYAEFARVDRAMAVKLPDELSFAEAAAVMESFVTAWEALVHLGELQSNNAVLIHAAVFATAASHRKTEVQDLGAHTVFDYSSEDFEQGIRLLTDGRDTDIVDGEYLARNLRSLKPGGRLIQVGLLSGQDNADMPLGLLLHNHLRLIGTVMKSRSLEE
jgi:NADPH2:quinone reductase